MPEEPTEAPAKARRRKPASKQSGGQDTPKSAQQGRKKSAESSAQAASVSDQSERQQSLRQASSLPWRVRKELLRLKRCGDVEAAQQLREVAAPLLRIEDFLMLSQPVQRP